MGFLSARDLTQAVVKLGSSRVLVAYPTSLGSWFDHLVVHDDDGVPPDGWVKLDADHPSNQFRVTASTGQNTAGLSVGDAMAAFWEQVAFLLVDALGDALALHAAAVLHGEHLVLIPGSSGAGKTQLTLWYRSRGFSLATDELVLLSSARKSAEVLFVSMFARPLFIKRSGNLTSVTPEEGIGPRQDYFGGQVVLASDIARRPEKEIRAGFVVFPEYVAGAPLHLTTMSRARMGQRLLGQCINVRNLPDGGLKFVSDAARCFISISLRYGATDQLSDTLDVLTRQILGVKPSASDLAALCDSFNARASSRQSMVPVQASMSSVAAPAVSSRTRRLTIGMATYDEYDGVYFTIQSIRAHHPEVANDIEFVVIDNNPDGPCAEALKQLGNWIDGYRYIPLRDWQGTAVRDAIFEYASCEIVMCVDPHVLIVPGALSRLLDYCQATPNSIDLLQGPLLYDDLRTISTHFEPRWQAGMYGVWEVDQRGVTPDSAAFDIPMQGLGVFVCRRAVWPGFNKAFRGFGGEEGYIHEKIRRRGGRTLCLPFLRWIHRFGRPLGVPYPNRWEDRLRNYYIGHTELGLDTTELETHFVELLGAENTFRILEEVRKEISMHPSENIKAEALPLTDEIHSPHNHSFGDQWATINFYLNMSIMKRMRIRVASQLNGINLYYLHREILDAIDSPGELVLTLSEPTVGVDGHNVWSAPYFPTKQRWDARTHHKYISVQLDGQSAPQATNPSPEEERLIIRYLEEHFPSFEIVRMGKHLSVQDCVNIAANSIFFIGVDSGMSHLCHSVGVPIFLLEYELPTITTHAGKAYTLCKGFNDLKGRIDRYAGYVRAADLPDAQAIRKLDEAGASTIPPHVGPEVPECAEDHLLSNSADRSGRPSTEALRERILLNAQIRSVLSLVRPSAVVGHSKVRIGCNADGGYVMINDLKDARICYSFGIGSDVSWDLEMAERGATIFQYDNKAEDPSHQHPSFRFRHIGLAPIDSRNMKTIQALLAENDHLSELGMVLKVDIEGAEWNVFDVVSVDILRRFRQIICEFHGFTRIIEAEWRERAERVLDKLAITHVPVHVHANNFGSFSIIEGIPIPDVIEVTFAERLSYAFDLSSESFPTELDRPNNSGAPDFYLGRFEF